MNRARRYPHAGLLFDEAAAETLKACLHRAFVETFPGAPTAGLIDAHRGASWAELKGSAPSQQSAEPRQ